MLTADLARSRTTAETATPLFIDPDDERYRNTARELIHVFEDHLGESKGDLDDAIDQLTIADTDYKIVRGLAKLIRDECEFGTVTAAEPREIRRQLFERANEQYPIVRQPTLGADTRQLDVYSTVADEMGLTLKESYGGCTRTWRRTSVSSRSVPGPPTPTVWAMETSPGPGRLQPS